LPERKKEREAVSWADMSLGKILVVEDEALIRETIELALQEEGFEVSTISDGRAALDLLQAVAPQSKLDFSLVILDLMLPNVNGLDICRLLRRQNNVVPILMLSAKGAETDRVVGLEVGADDYLTKPFGMRELIARCRALLRRQQQFQTQPQTGSHLSFGPISLYPQECRVTISAVEINLSPKEFKLLELFIAHPKRVWSREQLLEKVWGHDFIGDSKTVDVHIRWLREKLEQDPSHPQYLVTIRGFGYRFG
jgi:two-component system, OmpR family, phosphate regulon response regulator PhoB